MGLWKRWYTSNSVPPEIDLLTTAFGLPSRRELERASETVRTRRPSRYGSDSDDTSIDSQAGESDDSSCQSSLNVTNTKSGHQKVDHLFTPMPKSESGKKQHSKRRSLSSQSHRSTLSKKIKGSGRPKNRGSRFKTFTPKTSPRDQRVPASPSSLSHSSTEASSQAIHDRLPDAVNPSIQHVIPDNTSRRRPLYVPQQMPTLVPHYVPAYLFTRPKESCPTRALSQDQHTSFFPKSYNFEDLQDIQRTLDQLQQELLRRPQDPGLQRDYQTTQILLNNMLNAMVASSTKNIEKSGLNTETASGDTIKSTKTIADKENDVPANDRVVIKSQSSPIPQDGRDRTLLIAHARGKSPSCTIRHHLCSGCGSVRSPAFHEKYPISRGHKPVLNFCSSCREMRFEKGLVDNHHFCFGCGKVRSKAFQKKHKAKPGRALLPNYCGSCTTEVKMKEGMNEMSVLGMAVSHTMQLPGQNGSVTDTESSFVTDSFKHVLPTCKPDQTKELVMENSKQRNPAKLCLEHTSITNDISAPVSPAESSPFCPGRKLGSAQRRAQRVPTPHFKEEHARESDNSVALGEYHAPYVEEADCASDDELSSCNYSSVERSDSEDILVKCKRKRREDGRSEMFEPIQKNYQTPKDNYGRTAALRSTDPPAVRTLPDQPSVDKPIQPVMSKPKHNSRDFRHQESFDEPSRFSKGVFGKSSKDSGYYPGLTTRQQSPLADIECHPYATLNNHGGQKTETRYGFTGPEAPLSQSSRGAFGPEYSPRQHHSGEFAYSQSGFNRPEPGRPDVSKNQVASEADWEGGGILNVTGEYPQPGHTASASSFFSSDSNAGKPANKFRSRIPNDATNSRSVFTDYSRSTDNPYYKPRRHLFPNTAESDFGCTWDWKSNRGPNHHNARTYYDHRFDDRVPEPIIEEPASPPSSPIQRTKLLEFNITGDKSLGASHAEHDYCS
ncbi:hypothetical protein NOR_04793 [Metarhizium rileyi]|uniref:Uncharacterized protein n=1 Tax=Metarhizium rileyi (strain RCEF 4871) TaxID=1649241 RepID=A0A167DP48_METRR|nr:hypothetical protein NOR_04793 [Metarhizium rileyi RCEF 4871]